MKINFELVSLNFVLYFFQVTPENVAYLAALLAQSEEVRSRCHLKFGRNLSKSTSSDTFPVDLHLNLTLTTTANCTNSQGHTSHFSSPSQRYTSSSLHTQSSSSSTPQQLNMGNYTNVSYAESERTNLSSGFTGSSSTVTENVTCVTIASSATSSNLASVNSYSSGIESLVSKKYKSFFVCILKFFFISDFIII